MLIEKNSERYVIIIESWSERGIKVIKGIFIIYQVLYQRSNWGERFSGKVGEIRHFPTENNNLTVDYRPKLCWGWPWVVSDFWKSLNFHKTVTSIGIYINMTLQKQLNTRSCLPLRRRLNCLNRIMSLVAVFHHGNRSWVSRGSNASQHNVSNIVEGRRTILRVIRIYNLLNFFYVIMHFKFKKMIFFHTLCSSFLHWAERDTGHGK